jgi:TolA-binding protein
MLKHTVIAALLTLGLAAPAAAQTPVQTPTQTPRVTRNAQRAARVTPRAKRAGRLATAGDQGRAALRANLKATRSKLQALRKNGASTSLKERRQLKRQVRNLRQRVGKLRRHRK